MTVAVQDPINQFIISSVAQTTGPWTWQLNQASDLTVFKLSFDTGLITTLILDTDYTVNSTDLGNKLGGTITFLAAQIPPVVGDIWTLQRNTELSRNQDFATSGDFQAVTVNPQFDDPILIAQDTQRDAATAVRKDPAVGDTLNPLIPQPIVNRALIFIEPTPGNFELDMSESNVNTIATDAAASAAAAAASETAAAEDAADASEDADEAAVSAAEAEAAAASAAGLYQLNRIAGPYIGDFFDTGFEAADPEGIAFSADGLTMFIVDANAQAIFQYSLIHPFNLHSGNVEYTELFVDVSPDGIDAPQDVKFNTDGSKMFVLDGGANADITEYDLSVNFSFSGTVIDSGNSFSVSGQETTPLGFTFNPDGDLMFVVGSGNFPIEANRYTVVPAFSMAGTITPAGDFPLTNVPVKASAIAFSTDGTQMFALDGTLGDILDYTVPTAFSFSPPPSFTGNELEIASVDDSPTGMVFSQDGTKIFVTGGEFDRAYEFILPSPFTIPHGVEFSGLSFDLTGQSTLPRGVTFNNDGTRMFVPSANFPDTIFQYDLTIPYSLALSNVIFNGVSFSPTETPTIKNMVFNGDGSRMFVLDNGTTTGYEYTLSTNFDLASTVIFTTLTFDFSGEDNDPSSMIFSPDGFKLYMTGNQFDSIKEYNLASPFSFAALNVTFDGGFFNPTTQIINLDAIQFSPDGFFMFLMGSSTDHGRETMYQYELAGAFNLTAGITGAVTFTGSFFGVNGQDAAALGFVFNSDGSKFFVAGDTNDRIYEYDLVFPFRITQLVYPVEDDENGLLLQVGTSLGDVEVILPDSADLLANFRVGVVKVSPDENKVIVRHQGIDAINIDQDNIEIEAVDKVIGFFLDFAEPNWIADNGEATTALYNTNELIDVASLGANATGFSFISSADDNSPQDVAFASRGGRMFIIGDQGDTIYSYRLAVRYSLEFGVVGAPATFSIAAQETSPTGIAFDKAGRNMFITGTSPVAGTAQVFRYVLTKTFDILTASFSSSGTVFSQAPSPAGVRFNDNGGKMFVLDSSNSTLFQYALGTNYDPSTLVFSGFSFSFASEDITPVGFDFSKDGKTIFMAGAVSNSVFEYSLTNKFDLQVSPAFTGASFLLNGGFTRSFVFQQGRRSTGAGTKFFTVDGGIIGVLDYNLGSPYDLGDEFVVGPNQNGFLFTVDTTAGSIKINIPDSTLISEDFRFGVVKISGDANSINGISQGTDTVNGGASVSFATQFKVTLFSLDQATGNWTADLTGNLSSPGPIGDITPNTIGFTTLQGDGVGAIIDRFDNGSITTNSATRGVTQQAVNAFALQKNVNAVGQGDIANSAVGQGELKTSTQELSISFSGSPQNLNFTSVGEYGFNFQDKNDQATRAWTGYVTGTAFSSTSFTTHIIVSTNINPMTLTMRHRFMQASPPYDLGDGRVHTFIFAVIENSTGKIFAMNISQDPPWIYHADFGIKRSHVFTDPKNKKRMYHRFVKFDPTASNAQEIFDNPPIAEIVEYDNSLKMSGMPLFPHPYYGQVWNKQNSVNETVPDEDFWDRHHVALIDPVSKVAERLDTMCECGDDTLKLFHDGYLKIDNLDITNRKRPNGVACYGARWK